MRQCISLTVGAWRTFTDIDLGGFGGGGGGAADFLLNFGDTGDSDWSCPFCETFTDGSMSTKNTHFEKKRIFLRTNYFSSELIEMKEGH